MARSHLKYALLAALVIVALCCIVPAFASESESENENALSIETDSSVGPGSSFLEMHSLRKRGKGTLKKIKAKLKAKMKKIGAKLLKKLGKKKAKKAASKKAAKKAAKKAKKAAKKAGKKAAKKAKKSAKKSKKGKKLSKKLKKVAKKAIKKALKMAKKVGKKFGLKGKKLKKFLKKQLKKVKSKLFPKKASSVKDPKVKAALKDLKNKQSRANISKLQATLKKQKTGSVSVPIKLHKITVHPRTPKPKKLKLHKESPTDKNYVAHLHKTKAEMKDKIQSYKDQIHAFMTGDKGKQDWPIEYGTLDPPDSSKAALVKELLTDLKPFLKPAKAIKQGLLQEGRDNLVKMEALRNVIRDKLDKAKATPLFPEIYRFLG